MVVGQFHSNLSGLLSDKTEACFGMKIVLFPLLGDLHCDMDGENSPLLVLLDLLTTLVLLIIFGLSVRVGVIGVILQWRNQFELLIPYWAVPLSVGGGRKAGLEARYF